jgi:ATP-dependent DNA helicase RecQ
MDAYRERKRKALERVSHLKKYVTDPYGCRSRFVAVYFGDGEAGACGICDNCLRKKSIELTKEEFDTLQHRIINIIKYESLAGNELLEKLNGFKKEKTWKVLEFLEAENKIEVDSAGRVRLK